jgi:PAS domain S-box-containing protein
MILFIFLVHGLAMFALGIVGLRESTRRSALLLGRQLPWLAAFALVESIVQWLGVLQMTGDGSPQSWMVAVRFVLLPLAALLLIRFGVGLLSESGPLPNWLLLFPYFFLVPASLVLGYALVVILTEPGAGFATPLWVRYLLFIPGGIFTAWGFIRQSQSIPASSNRVNRFMFASALAFLAYTLVVGLIAPLDTEHIPETVEAWLGIEEVMPNLHAWQAGVAVFMAFVVVGALGVFEIEQAERLREAEARRAQVERVLRESEERFRNIFELAPIGMHLVDSVGRVLRVNRVIERMLGYQEAELQQMQFIDFTHPDDQAESLRLTREVSAGERNTFQLEKRYIAKDGRLIDGRVTVSALRNEQGQFSCFLAMVEDVTERNRIERAYQAERARAQQERLQTLAEARRTTESWINSMVETSRLIAQMQSLDDILVRILAETQRLLQADVVSLGLFDEQLRLLVRCQATAQGAHLLDPPPVVDNEELTAILIEGEPRQFSVGDGLADVNWYCPTVARRVQAAAVVPLQFDESVVGGLWVGSFERKITTPAQFRGLSYLADQVIIALQQATMAAQLQSIATVQERARIAREMHDGLSQILGYLGLQIQTVECLMNQGELERALDELARTRANVKAAHADVRDNILSLRTTLAGSGSLTVTLSDYLDGYEQQTGLELQLTDDAHGDPGLSPLTEVQVIRVIQEALSNVRKHAAAQQVMVRLWLDGGYFYVSIRDDGRGFTVGESGDAASFGLETMRERMEAVGGRLAIRSHPGEGTEVSLAVPRLKLEGDYAQTTATFAADRG